MNPKLDILFVEDDQIELMKLNRTITKLEMSHNIFEAKNGEQAIEILKSKKVVPNIILLDLNMPKMSGLEFLKILKADESLRYIPTIILSTSNNHNDVISCYEVGIAGYIVKPLKYEDYVQKLKAVLTYWSTNELVKM